MNIPNTISLARVTAAPVLLVSAFTGSQLLFLGVFAFMMVTDFLDGFLARRLNQSTDLGAQLDTLGDSLTVAFLFPGGWILWPETYHDEFVFFLLAPVMLGISGSLALIRHGHLPSYHTLSAKLSTALAGLGIWLLFAGVTPLLFRGAMVLLAFSALEEIWISLVLPAWHPNIRSVRQALRERSAMQGEERPPPVPQTKMEETLNAITHGIAAAAAVPVLVLMVICSAQYGDPWLTTGVSIFGCSLILMYALSTLYHALPAPSGVKRLFRIFDHVAIFVLIAGTYTPFMLGPMRGAWGWSLFGVVWGLALAGTVLKVFFAGRARLLSVAVYLAMGWLVLIAFRPLMEVVSVRTAALLAAGGVAYTGGTVFYASLRLKYHHGLWHLFVLAGSIFHVLAVFSLLGSGR